MAKIEWDQPKDRFYEIGVRNGVLYVQDDLGEYGTGVPWNGLTTITTQGSGAEGNVVWADDLKYTTVYSTETLGLTIEAWTYPDEFLECDGSRIPVNGENLQLQYRRPFALCYRTVFGNALLEDDFGYKLHIVYGCKASPTEKSFQTMSDSVEPASFSWEVNTTPVSVNGFKPTSEVVIDSTLVSSDAMELLESWLYGSEERDPTLLMPDDIKDIIEHNSVWFYSYSDLLDNGHVLIKKKANRVQTYSYSDDGDGNVVIVPLADRTYSYTDPQDDGNVVIDKVTA